MSKTDIHNKTMDFLSEARKAAAEADAAREAETLEGAGEPADAPQAPETPRAEETPAPGTNAPQDATWEARREAFKSDIEEARRIFITGEPKSRRTHIMFRPSVYAKLEEAAARDRVSVNEWINQAVVEKLERDDT